MTVSKHNYLDPLRRTFVGFDDIFKQFENFTSQVAENYPPFNIRKVDENKYTVELAVAGFTKQNLDIHIEGKTLRITGKTGIVEDDKAFIFKGIANRAFSRCFTMADSIVVKDAEIINGILKVYLESVAPMFEKKTIDIKEGDKK